MDYVGRFITDHFEIVPYDAGNPATVQKSSELYQEYRLWADEEGYPLKNQGQFMSSLKHKGLQLARVYLNGKQVRCILGLQRIITMKKQDTRQLKTDDS